MGRLLNELIAESRMAEAANPANLAGQAPPDSQDSQAIDVSAVRIHLLALVADEFIPRQLVDALPGAEVIACAGYGDAELRAYLHGLERGRVMDAGLIPGEYSALVYCAGCGPVLLWPSYPQVVKACPWCFRRKAGKPIPRPVVRCRDCQQYRPDRITAHGICTTGHATTWPTRSHRCAGWTPANCPNQETPQ